MVLGICIGACVLIRHVGVCIGAAVIMDLALRRRWRVLRAAVLSTVLIILPWAVWLLIVREHTQVGLLVQGQPGHPRSWSDDVLHPAAARPDQRPAGRGRHGLSPLDAGHRDCESLGGGHVGDDCVWLVEHPQEFAPALAGLTAVATLALLLVWPFTEAGRFLVPVVPFLLVGTTEGLARILRIARPKDSRLWASGMVLAASMPYAVYAIAAGRAEAQRQTHADFDVACSWLAQHASRPGTVLTRHPGELFWQTGRLAVAADSADPDSIEGLIDRLGVSYLLIDEDRYAQAAANPLGLYVERYPERSTLIWSKARGTTSIQIREIVRPRHRATPGTHTRGDSPGNTSARRSHWPAGDVRFPRPERPIGRDEYAVKCCLFPFPCEALSA